MSFNFSLGFAIGLLFIILFYGGVFFVLKIEGTIDRFKRIPKVEWILILVWLVGLVIYFCWLCSQDQRIVNWDSGFYWIKVLNYNASIFTEPLKTLKEIYNSIEMTDYSNVIPAIISIPFSFIGKNSYTLYRVQLFTMFQIPTYLVMADILVRIITQLGINFKNKYFFAIMVCSLVSYVYIPTVYGLFDIADLLLINLVVLILLDWNWSDFDWKRGIILSILFLEILFVRRHFSFFCLGFFGFYLVINLICTISKFRHDRERMKISIVGYIKNSILVGGVCITVLMLFFRHYLKRTLLNDYAVEYGARSVGNMGDKFIVTFKWIGLALVAFAVVGIIKLIIAKKYEILVVNVASTLFIMFMFFRIQSLSNQHYLNFTPQMMMLIFVGVCSIWDWILKGKKIAILSEILILFLSFAHGMIPSVDLGKWRIFPSVNYQPEIRTDLAEIERLLTDAKNMTVEIGETAYCLSSSGILNDDILRNFYLPKTINSFQNLSRTYDIDMQGGFPIACLDAKVVMVAEPAQTHANYDGQRNIWGLGSIFLGGEAGIFYDNYNVEDVYNLDNGVKVYLYEKVKDFTEDDYIYLVQIYDEWYPEFPNLYKDRIISYAAEKGITVSVQ